MTFLARKHVYHDADYARFGRTGNPFLKYRSASSSPFWRIENFLPSAAPGRCGGGCRLSRDKASRTAHYLVIERMSACGPERPQRLTTGEVARQILTQADSGQAARAPPFDLDHFRTIYLELL